MLLDSDAYPGSRPKSDFTVAVLPTFVNHEQPSTKKKPFSTLLDQTFSHTLDVLVPNNSVESLKQALASGNGSDGSGTLRYARVYMKLSEIIEGDFFNAYIKTGNILMLSQGRSGHDHLFSLSEGVLHIEVDRPTYERMGLEGKAIASQGRKHVKARFVIDVNLRLPSMVHGKKSFERVAWAFKNVLSNTITWLFHDLKGPNDGTGPIAAHQPQMYSITAEVSSLDGVLVSDFQSIDEREYDAEEAVELLEWLGLAFNLSPRVQQNDKIDPFLCRYRTPFTREDRDDEVPINAQDLVRFRWRGFIPSTFVTAILLSVMKASGDAWFAMNAASFDGQAYTILRSGNETLIWQYAG